MPRSKGDFSQPATGYSDKNDETESDSDYSITSYSDLLAKLSLELDHAGYKLHPEVGGDFCGHSVYKKEHRVNLKGLMLPDKFWYWRRIRPSSESITFQRVVKGICEDFMSTCGKSEFTMWREIGLSFMDSLADCKTKVSIIAQGYYGSMGASNEHLTITLNGNSGHYRYLPKLDWFPEGVRAIDARSLLTLFPEAEARQLMLILGRVVVGANGTYIAEGQILHTARSYGLIVGTDAGLGKSTLMKWISEALGVMGYKVVSTPINDTKFGWGEPATSSMMYIDDLTDEIQKRLLADAKVKIIVSNNQLKVEEKGKPAVDVRATTVIMGCTNAHNYAHYINMDSGSISRVNLLDTYTRNELDRLYPNDGRIMAHWEKLSDKLSVSPVTLAAYLLRQSADYFLSTCGYVWDDDGRLWKEKPDQLEYVSKDLRAKFRIDTSLRHAEELPVVAANLVALTIAATPRRAKDYMNLLDNLDFSASLVLAVMRLFASINSRVKLDPELKGTILTHAALDCQKYIRDKLGGLDKLSSVKSSEESFKTVIAELKSTKGFNYPTRSSHYLSGWVSSKREVPTLVLMYQQCLDKTPELPDVLETAVAEIGSIFSAL
jgi:hypothetical protein